MSRRLRIAVTYVVEVGGVWLETIHTTAADVSRLAWRASQAAFRTANRIDPDT
jgi:hypothetical protein